MTIKYHRDLVQGTEEWREARRGVLTASEMHLIITPKLKVASNDKERSHLYELLAQRMTKYVEPAYVSDDMLRGQSEEIYAKMAYAENYANVEDVGFVTNDKWGFTLGYSPDALVGKTGQIECKSRRQKFQVQTIAEGIVPEEYMIQIQTGLIVTQRKWCDFVSYSGGLPMFTIRVKPDPEFQEAIIAAAWAFEQRLAEKLDAYQKMLASKARLIPTERRIEQEMFI